MKNKKIIKRRGYQHVYTISGGAESNYRLYQSQQREVYAPYTQNVPNTNSYDIDECLSKLYLVTLENFDTYKSSPNKTGWLFLALKNISSDYRREKKKDDKPGSDSLEENEYSLADNFSEDDMIFSILTNHLPEEVLVELILSELSEKERLLFELRFRQHAEYADIAKQFKQSQSGIRRQVSQLKSKITDIVHNGKLFEYVQKMK